MPPGPVPSVSVGYDDSGAHYVFVLSRLPMTKRESGYTQEGEVRGRRGLLLEPLSSPFYLSLSLLTFLSPFALRRARPVATSRKDVSCDRLTFTGDEEAQGVY